MQPDGIIYAYCNEGIQGLDSYFGVDALIGGQGWCQQVYAAYCNSDHELVHKLIQDEIKNRKGEVQDDTGSISERSLEDANMLHILESDFPGSSGSDSNPIL